MAERTATFFKVLAVALALLGSTALAVWAGGKTESPGSQAPQTTLAKIKQQGYIAVGFANEDPYGYADTSGKLTGESPEIARYIVQQIDPNVKLEGVLTEFGSLIPGLQAHRFDMVAAGMFITPVRCKQVTFTNRSSFSTNGRVRRRRASCFGTPARSGHSSLRNERSTSAWSRSTISTLT